MSNMLVMVDEDGDGGNVDGQSKVMVNWPNSLGDLPNSSDGISVSQRKYALTSINLYHNEFL